MSTSFKEYFTNKRVVELQQYVDDDKIFSKNKPPAGNDHDSADPIDTDDMPEKDS